MRISKKVIIAISGGVDSSVAAVLLKKQGYKVTGLYLRLFKDGKKEKRIKRIAKAIGIPLVIKDAKKEFKKKVIDYFLREYKEGRTPNPCVICNREIKFKFLFEELAKMKADYVATGHYARTSPHPPRPHPSLRATLSPLSGGERERGEGKSHLFSARDKTKDQSYFLYTFTQKQLAKILFPLGNYKKEEVKKIARNLKLPVSEEESQSVCFIAEKCPDEFLRKNIKMKPGNIVEINRNKVEIDRNKVEISGNTIEIHGNKIVKSVIGRHLGLPLYTVGQRRNILIGGTGPYYVVGKDFKKNELLVVRSFNNPLLYKKKLLIKNVNWIAGDPASWSHRGESKFPLRAKVCIRYHHPAINAIIKPLKHKNIKALKQGVYMAKFKKPQRAVTPGQAAVIYSDKGEVLGGGVIQ